jgi:hypothetical protein
VEAINSKNRKFLVFGRICRETGSEPIYFLCSLVVRDSAFRNAWQYFKVGLFHLKMTISKRASRGMVPFRVILLFLWITTLAVVVTIQADEDELISVPLEEHVGCTFVGGCLQCEEQASNIECKKTGYIQQFKCAEQLYISPDSNMTKTVYRHRHESCSPSEMEGWMEILRFDMLMFLGAVVSLIYVRARKQHAAYSLVSLVNRS